MSCSRNEASEKLDFCHPRLYYTPFQEGFSCRACRRDAFCFRGLLEAHSTVNEGKVDQNESYNVLGMAASAVEHQSSPLSLLGHLPVADKSVRSKWLWGVAEATAAKPFRVSLMTRLGIFDPEPTSKRALTYKLAWLACLTFPTWYLDTTIRRKAAERICGYDTPSQYVLHVATAVGNMH